jgi:four helix bundle protein
MTQQQMKDRTKEYAKRTLKVCRSLTNSGESKLIGNQLLRAATSVGANYRSACRSRSKADFIAKLGIVLEEADESVYWLEILHETNILAPHQLKSLIKEGDELIAILVATITTAKSAK